MRNPKISVLLIVRDALPLVAGTLDSLKAQTLKDFEVVAVDGASTDGTLDVLHGATKVLPLRIVSEPDRSLAEAFAKGIRRATGDIVGMLCADERYYPNTLEQVAKWFEAEPNAAMCGGKVDFIDEHDKVIGSHLTPPFNLAAHLACELVPSNLASFFQSPSDRRGFPLQCGRADLSGLRVLGATGFPFSAIGVQTLRRQRRASLSHPRFDVVSGRELHAVLPRQARPPEQSFWPRAMPNGDIEAVRRRSSAGIHMWAAEQLNVIEPGHPDILAHCAAAARYDKSL